MLQHNLQKPSGDVSVLDVNTCTTEIQLHTKTLVLRFAVEVYHL